jgi:hypothetical protein
MQWWICLGVFAILVIAGSVIGAIKHKEVVQILHPSASSPVPMPVNGVGLNGMTSPPPGMAPPLVPEVAPF